MRVVVIAVVALGLVTMSDVAYAGNGTLVVEVVKKDGHRTAADCDVKRGASLTKRIRVGTGVAQTGLAAGSYTVSCKSRIGSLAGSLNVRVTSGKTGRYRIVLRPTLKPIGKRLPKAKLTGRITDRAGRPLSGQVQVVLTVTLKNGRFDAGALPPGNYTVKYLERGRTKATRKVSVRRGKATTVNMKVGRTRPRPIRKR